MIRRILVGLGSQATAAAETQQAVELADRYGASLTGVTIVDSRPLESIDGEPPDVAPATDELRRFRHETARKHLDAAVAVFEDGCRRAGVRYRLQREERADPFDRLISESRYHDLVISGLRGLFDSGLVGRSAAESAEALARLVSHGVRPIIAVAPQHRPVRRVFIAYSGSVESAKTMRQFVQLRPWLEVQLRIGVFGQTPDRAARLLEGAAEYCRSHGYQPELIHLPGAPHDQILPAAADWNADLLVLGNSARNLMLRRVLGETALHVMQHSPLPLFLSQ